MKRIMSPIVKIALTVTLLIIVFMRIDFSFIQTHLKNFKFILLLLAVMLMFLQCLLGVLKWHLILRFVGITHSFVLSSRVFWAGLFFNSFFPGGVAGDSMRVWMVRRSGNSLSKIIDSVLLDRLVGLLVVILACLISVPVLKRLGIHTPLIHLFEIFAIGGILGFIFLSYLNRLPVTWARFRITQVIHQLSIDTYRLWTSPIKFIVISLVAFMGISWQIFLIYVLAQLLHLPILFLHCCVFVPPVILLTALPISIGGWGVRESAMVALSGIMGISSSAALSLSIMLGIVTLLMSLPGGIIWMLWRKTVKNSSIEIKPSSLLA